MSFIANIIFPIISTVVPSLAARYINKKISPKIAPVIEAISEIEKVNPDRKNSDKHRDLLIFIKSTPIISKFILDCGWNPRQVDTFVAFCVLMYKKPPHEKENRDKWNDEDKHIMFDLLAMLAGRWLTMFNRKR